MEISILTIGNELLNGSTLNTNASWIGKSLTKLGCQIKKQITVKDNKGDVENALNTLLINNPSYVIITGGLGSTSDDITRDIIFNYVGVKKNFDKEYWLKLSQYFKNSGKNNFDFIKNQAYIPSSGKIIPNPSGSARGFNFNFKKSKIIVLPGVPSEMKKMMTDSIIPDISSLIKNKYYSKKLRTTGIPESFITANIKDEVLIDDNCSIGYYPSAYGVDLTISGYSLKKVKNLSVKIETTLKKNIYSKNDDSLEKVVVGVGIKMDKTLAVAESCTGGLLGSRITEVEGSSAFFKGGVVSYSNESKIDILGVKRSTLKSCGAVSTQVAAEMAERIRKLFSVDYGISITGIAGPSGGTESKPVGLVHIGLSSKLNTVVKKFIFSTSRSQIKIKTSQAALNILRLELVYGR